MTLYLYYLKFCKYLFFFFPVGNCYITQFILLSSLQFPCTIYKLVMYRSNPSKAYCKCEFDTANYTTEWMTAYCIGQVQQPGLKQNGVVHNPIVHFTVTVYKSKIILFQCCYKHIKRQCSKTFYIIRMSPNRYPFVYISTCCYIFMCLLHLILLCHYNFLILQQSYPATDIHTNEKKQTQSFSIIRWFILLQFLCHINYTVADIFKH